MALRGTKEWAVWHLYKGTNSIIHCMHTDMDSWDVSERKLHSNVCTSLVEDVIGALASRMRSTKQQKVDEEKLPYLATLSKGSFTPELIGNWRALLKALKKADLSSVSAAFEDESLRALYRRIEKDLSGLPQNTVTKTLNKCRDICSECGWMD